MAAFIVASGTKCKREVTEGSIIGLIPFTENKCSDILWEDKKNELVGNIKMKMTSILSINTGQTEERIIEDINNGIFLTAEEAVEYRICDKILKTEL